MLGVGWLQIQPRSERKWAAIEAHRVYFDPIPPWTVQCFVRELVCNSVLVSAAMVCSVACQCPTQRLTQTAQGSQMLKANLRGIVVLIARQVSSSLPDHASGRVPVYVMSFEPREL